MPEGRLQRTRDLDAVEYKFTHGECPFCGNCFEMSVDKRWLRCLYCFTARITDLQAKDAHWVRC